MPVMTYREAVAQALREALDEDPRVFLMGEDIGPYGGAFAVTKGFWDQYGQERIKDSPLSESVIVGAGVG
ncbi:MAG: alpha-ketoacid dehydrogenase subunit beta, partial [Chloroflexi bacterium]|nr:alpha-ketoacid dehydrogenase subunit beta [Chloroflexota bacterium]